MPRFRPEEIIRAFNDCGVDYVVIGGYAASMQGSPFATEDIDLTPCMTKDNLARVSTALTQLNARVRHPDIDEGPPFSHDATSLAAAVFWNLTTDFGDLDLSFHPAGTGGFDDLVQRRVLITIRGLEAPMASLADIVRSKDAANRDKDRRVLPTLRRILDDQLESERQSASRSKADKPL